MVRERLSQGDGSEKPRKTFSSALGINPETEGIPPAAQGQMVPPPQGGQQQQYQQPPMAPAASLFTPPAQMSPEPTGQSPAHEIQQPASPALPVSGAQPAQVPLTSVPASQTITTPLSIPGMPPITVSAPLIMPPPMQPGQVSTTSVPQNPAMTVDAAAGIQQSYNPWSMPQSQQSPPISTAGTFQTPPPLTSQYHPRPVALFNPVANSTPTSVASPTGDNFVRMYDPNNPMGQPAVSQS